MSSVLLADKHDTTLGLNLDVGSFLEIRMNGFQERFKAVVIGQAYEEYLLIKTALPKEFETDLQAGVTVHVSYQNMGPRYCFESQVLEIIQRPYPLTFITYPKRVSIIKKRELPRASCYIPSSVLLNDNRVKGTVTDINSKGCRFVIRLPENLMPRQVTLLDDICLTFPAVGSCDIEAFQGSVRNTIIDREKISMGIEFKELDPNHLACIDYHMADAQSL